MRNFSVIYPDFELAVKKIHTKTGTPHRHRYFEMMYVLQGQGRHIINGNQYNYQKGDLFLLNTYDTHSFITVTPSEMCIVDFTGSFFSFIRSGEKSNYPSVGFFEQLEYIFHNQYRLKGNIIAQEKDKKWADSLVERLLSEKEGNGYGSTEMCKNIVFLLLQLISRYIQGQSPFALKSNRAQSMVRDITNYIHRHIYHNEQLKIEAIAAHCCKSRDHIRLYFKKQTGITLKDYILSYKFELVKTRLLHSDLTVAAIAAELSFTDESHLNKFIKHKTGFTASAYRNKYSENI